MLPHPQFFVVIEGARPDDLDYMRSHHIDPIQVSSEITTIFSKMMFIHG